tara:strand:- start:866 stop:1414 length:549 start_codon:yes stop_codon:yes gene_type:complete
VPDLQAKSTLARLGEIIQYSSMDFEASETVLFLEFGLWGKFFSSNTICQDATDAKISDQVFTGIMAGEAKSPRYSMAHATKLVPIRVFSTFMLSIAFISILIPQDDPRLFGGSGVAASPFVIALNDAGIKGLPDFLNVVMMIGIASIAVESIYISSRIMRSMALQGLIPKFIANVDKEGRPR